MALETSVANCDAKDLVFFDKPDGENQIKYLTGKKHKSQITLMAGH
jgi:hypothetical protein